MWRIFARLSGQSLCTLPTNFQELRQREVLRIHLLSTWVHKGKEKGLEQLRPGPLLKAVRYLFLLFPPHFATLKVHTSDAASALAGSA